MKKTLQIFAIIFSAALLPSCSKKADIDIRDGFVGNWKQTKVNGSASTSNDVVVIAKNNVLANGLSIDTDNATATSATSFSYDNKKLSGQKNVLFTSGKTGNVYFTNGTGVLVGTTIHFSFGTLIEYTDGSTGKLVNDPATTEYTKQ